MKESVGKRMYECRKAAGLTQTQVAARLGVAQPVYQRFEKGIYECNYEQLVFLADLFGVAVDYLLGRKSTDHPIFARRSPLFLRKRAGTRIGVRFRIRRELTKTYKKSILFVERDEERRYEKDPSAKSEKETEYVFTEHRPDACL